MNMKFFENGVARMSLFAGVAVCLGVGLAFCLSRGAGDAQEPSVSEMSSVVSSPLPKESVVRSMEGVSQERASAVVSGSLNSSSPQSRSAVGRSSMSARVAVDMRDEASVADAIPPRAGRSAVRSGARTLGSQVDQQQGSSQVVRRSNDRAANDPVWFRSNDVRSQPVVETSEEVAEDVSSNELVSNENENDDAVSDGESEDDVEAEEEMIVPTVNVVQLAHEWSDGEMQVSFAIFPDEDDSTAVPNGLIVSQPIPDGWEVMEAVPQIEVIDGDPRTAKWLLVGEAAEGGSIYSMSIRASEEESLGWNDAGAWYTYRQADGECVDVKVIPYEESDIQPEESD